jgi:hypothetical protein
VLEEGEGAYVVEMALGIRVPEAHSPLPVAEEYHWYEKVEVPPDSCDVRVMDWLLSIDGAEGVTAPADRAVLTVTSTTLEYAVSAGVPALLSPSATQ